MATPAKQAPAVVSDVVRTFPTKAISVQQFTKPHLHLLFNLAHECLKNPSSDLLKGKVCVCMCDVLFLTGTLCFPVAMGVFFIC